MTISTRSQRSALAAISVLALLSGLGLGAQQSAPPAGAAAQAGGRAGGRGGTGATLFTAVDTDKDGALTRSEMQAAFSDWFAKWDTARTGALAEAEIASGLAAVFPAPAARGGGAPRTANEGDVQEMLKVLPSAAPARPARPRRALVLAHSPGFTHSSIPLAARTIEELGKRTGAWTTTVSYDPNVVTREQLAQYDVIVLNSTVGAFLDEAGDQAASDARRAAFLAFVREGKGLVGIHAASDTYHAGAANTPFTRQTAAAAVTGPPAQLAAALVGQGDKNGDQRLSSGELRALVDSWFDTLDTAKAGRVTSAEFAERFNTIVPPAGGRAGGRTGGAARGDAATGVSAPSGGTWPEFNRMIGGIFKNHPWQQVPIKIEDAASPLTAMFKNRSFEFQDETYTFYQDSWSRANVRVLMSIDYAKMTDAAKAQENRNNARTDGDYGLSWVRREGRGRVFYFALGHREDGIYRSPEMLAHLLAGMQYAIGDLKADDTPGK